jgi:outer membrane protein insertion porin family
MRFLHTAVALMLAPAALAQHPVAQIKIAGNVRLPAAAVIAATGLRVGQTATRAQFDAAVQKLADTGLFASVSYEYDSQTIGGVTGYALTFRVSEQRALVPVELDIPGQDTEHLWQQLKSSNGLIDRQMPDNELASAYYKRAVEAVLRKSNQPEEVVVVNEKGDLYSGKPRVAFRPANLPKIAAIRFEGNAAIVDARLQAAMARVAIGQEYTERDFRSMLELNVRPLYEELGRLTMTFPRVSMARADHATRDAAITVTAGIDEGPEWRLGNVVLSGAALPLADMHEAARFDRGSPANWKEFMASVAKMEQVLRRDGYIHVYSNAVRSFQKPAQIVDVTVEVAKGPQFMFGELHIEGLDADTQKRLNALWQLPSGAPMNQPYIDEFVHSALPILRGKFKTFKSWLQPHSGANVVDVMLRFS